MADNLLRLVIGAGQRKALSNPGSQPRASMNKGGGLARAQHARKRFPTGTAEATVAAQQASTIPGCWWRRDQRVLLPPISATAGTRPRITQGTLGWSPGEPTPSTQGPLPIQAELSKSSRDSGTFHPLPTFKSALGLLVIRQVQEAKKPVLDCNSLTGGTGTPIPQSYILPRPYQPELLLGKQGQ